MRLNYWYEPTPLNCASSCILYSRWPPGVSSAKQNTWCSTKIDLLQAARGQRSSRLRIQIMNSKQQLLSEPVGWRQPIIGHLLESANEAHIVTSFAPPPPNSYWNIGILHLINSRLSPILGRLLLLLLTTSTIFILLFFFLNRNFKPCICTWKIQM